MPALRAFTATSAAIKQIADAALADPEGVSVTWLTTTYGLEACKSRARSFQTSFCSMRARARRLNATHTGADPNALDMESRGPYDRLACIPQALPDGAGYSVSLMHADSVLDDLVVVSASTGKPIEREDPNARKMRVLMAKAVGPEARNLTREEVLWMLDYEPSCFTRDDGTKWLEFTLSEDIAPVVGQDADIPDVDDMFG